MENFETVEKVLPPRYVELGARGYCALIGIYENQVVMNIRFVLARHQLNINPCFISENTKQWMMALERQQKKVTC